MTQVVTARVRETCAQSALLFIALVVPLVFSIRLEDGFELTQILCALTATAFLLLTLPGGGAWASFKANTDIHLPFLGFLAVGVLSYFHLRQEVSFYFPTQNYLWVLCALLFLIPLGGLMEKRKFLSFLVLGGVLGSLYSFLQAFGLDLAGWDTDFGGRSFSTLGNPIFWAGHLLVLLPLSIHLLASAKGKGEKAFWTGALLLLLLSLLFAKTRGAWLGLLGEVLILAVLSRKRPQVWKTLGLGVILFLLAILLVPSLSERALSMFHVKGRDAQGRYFLWEVAWEQWKEKKILGQGPGGYAAHFHRVQSELSQEHPFRPYWTAFHAHNEYLEVLAERGIVGFALGGMVLWGLVRRRIDPRGMGAMNGAPTGWIQIPAAEIAVIAGIAIHSLFNSPLSVVPTACALALLFNPSWGVPSSPSSAGLSSVGRFWTEPRLFATVGFLLLLALGMRVAAQNARLHSGIDQARAQDYERAFRLLDFELSSGVFHYLDSRVLKWRAEVLEGMGRRGEALETLHLVSDRYPYDADARASLCMLYGKRKEWKKAEAQGLKALAIAPSHEQGLNNMAMIAFLRHKRREATWYLDHLAKAQDYWGFAERARQTRGKIEALGR